MIKRESKQRENSSGLHFEDLDYVRRPNGEPFGRHKRHRPNSFQTITFDMKKVFARLLMLFFCRSNSRETACGGSPLKRESKQRENSSGLHFEDSGYVRRPNGEPFGRHKRHV